MKWLCKIIGHSFLCTTTEWVGDVLIQNMACKRCGKLTYGQVGTLEQMEKAWPQEFERAKKRLERAKQACTITNLIVRRIITRRIYDS